MNKVTRSLAITGIAVTAGLSLAVSPASAAPAGPRPPAPAADHRVQIKKTAFKGFHRTGRDCVRIGRIGQIRGQWHNFDCDRVNRGFKRGWYALNVSWTIRSHGHGPIKHDNRPHRGR